jgi:nitrogen fixation/metabolism regulation signal transduction histidine kinase
MVETVGGDRSRALPAAPPAPPDLTALEAERRMLNAWIDQTPAPMVVLEPDGSLRVGNRAGRSLFGTADRLTDPPPGLAAALQSSTPHQRHTLHLETPGGRRAYALAVADVRGANGPVRLAALVDIQSDLQAAEAAALRDLLQVLSHEIMNSLTPVASLGATARDLLDHETSENAVLARDAIATLARRAEGLTRFVDAYRTLARLPPPTLAPVSLSALLEEAARLFRSRWTGKGVTLALIKPEPDIMMKLDADLMLQALLNVLTNGAEAALEGEGPPSVHLSALMQDGRLSLMVEDNGPGVTRADPSAIFRPFFTTKPQGSGVGLSLSRQILLSHGGDLVLGARDGIAPGARLIFRL